MATGVQYRTAKGKGTNGSHQKGTYIRGGVKVMILKAVYVPWARDKRSN